MSATIRDVAKRAGVGVGTVSRVLNDHSAVRASTRQRVLDAIKELNYVPSQTARRLSSGKTMMIGLVAPFFTTPSVVERLRGIESVIGESDYDLTIFNVESEDGLRDCFQALYGREKADGLITISVGPTEAEYLRFQNANMPVIMIDGDLPYLNRVSVDDTFGGLQATQHLLKLGHTRIGFVSDLDKERLGNHSTADRFLGYQQALTRAGLEVDNGLILAGEHGRHAGYEMGFRLLFQVEGRPTAIVCTSDTYATGVLQAAYELDIDVPYELSVIGYDDIEMAKALNLTTLHQPLFESGVLGANWLLDQLAGETTEMEKRVLATKLVLRGTTTRPVS